MSPAAPGGFFSRLFDADFTPRSVCIGPQNPETIWLHAISDSLIALAYFSIPLALLYFVRRRRDLAFNWMFVMFAAFILACGATHVFNVLAIWHPVYRFDGVVKLLTGAISIGTAAALWPLIPKALALPSPGELRVANESLEREVEERVRAETELRQARDLLEERVAERTRELAAANVSLQAEVAHRQRMEEHQALMVAELDHRVKNNMATVLSLAEQTAQSSPAPADFVPAFMGRITSLARLHETLARFRWGGADLLDLIRQTIAPYTDENGNGQISVDGEALTVPPRVGTTVCMALHELATNAAKYGALSVPDGRIAIRWRVEPRPAGAAGRQVRLTWEETGGPPVEPPGRTGFGIEFITAGVRYELRGDATLEFRPGGVVCHVVWPITDPPAGERREHGGSAGMSAAGESEKGGHA